MEIITSHRIASKGVDLIDLNSDRKRKFADVPGDKVAEKRRTDAGIGGIL